jgi:hypothetical protein
MEQGLGHQEGVAADVGDRDQEAHQHEQRYGREDVVRHPVVGGQVEQAHGHAHVLADEPDAGESDADQGHRDVHAQEHEDRQGTDDEGGESEFRHCGSPNSRA